MADRETFQRPKEQPRHTPNDITGWFQTPQPSVARRSELQRVVDDGWGDDIKRYEEEKRQVRVAPQRRRDNITNQPPVPYNPITGRFQQPEYEIRVRDAEARTMSMPKEEAGPRVLKDAAGVTSKGSTRRYNIVSNASKGAAGGPSFEVPDGSAILRHDSVGGVQAPPRPVANHTLYQYDILSNEPNRPEQVDPRVRGGSLETPTDKERSRTSLSASKARQFDVISGVDKDPPPRVQASPSKGRVTPGGGAAAGSARTPSPTKGTASARASAAPTPTPAAADPAPTSRRAPVDGYMHTQSRRRAGTDQRQGTYNVLTGAPTTAAGRQSVRQWSTSWK